MDFFLTKKSAAQAGGKTLLYWTNKEKRNLNCTNLYLTDYQWAKNKTVLEEIWCASEAAAPERLYVSFPNKS